MHFTPIPKKEIEVNYEKIHTSECVTRQMTPGEREKYFGEKESKKMPVITKKELFELFKKHGTTSEAKKEIAKITKLAVSTISTYFTRWGIKEELGLLQNAEADSKDPIGTEVEKEAVVAYQKEDKPVAEATLTIKQDEILPKIVYEEYKVGNANVGISYAEKLIAIGSDTGNDTITFKEMLQIGELTKNKIDAYK